MSPVIRSTQESEKTFSLKPVADVPDFDMHSWWKSPFRIVQTNLRLIDVQQDPRDIAAAVQEFGGNTIVSNIGGIVAFYPTQLDLQWVNPHLQSDFVGEMIEAAHAQGLGYIGRFDLSKGMQQAYDAHPDWFMLNRTGLPRTYENTYQACPNGGWAREYGFEILREGLSRYAVDGIFFNMSGYPPADYANVSHGICVCENCHRRFREMYGLALPAVDGFADPAWPQYLEFQQRTAGELADQSRAIIRDLRPAAGTIGFRPQDDMYRYETQRRVHREAPEWAYQSGEQSRRGRGANPRQATASTSAAHIDYPWRQVTETAAYHLLREAQQLATGSWLDLYVMGTIADQNDPDYLPPVSELFQWFGANAGSYEGLVDDSRIGLYDSAANRMWGGTARSGSQMGKAFRGAYSMLVEARLPFSFANADRVAAGTDDLNARFDTLILPDIAVLSDAEAEELDRFVERGGLLIATGETGSLAEYGARRDGMAMRSSPVIAFGEPVDCHGWTFDGVRAAVPVGGRIPATGHYWPVEAREGAVDILPSAPLQPFGPPEISYAEPDAPCSDAPGALLRRHGKGTSVHIPWLPEWLYYRDGLPVLRNILANLVKSLAPLQPVRIEGRGPVELTVQRQQGRNRLLVHVVNYSGQRNTLYEEPVDIAGLRLGVRHDCTSATALVAGQDLVIASGPDEDGYRWFDLPPVRHFEAVSIDLA